MSTKAQQNKSASKNKYKISNPLDATIKEISEPRNFKPDTLDRISGSYGSYNCKVVEKTMF